MKGENKGGRPPYDYALMFEIVILQRYYNLGDDSTERVRHFGPVVVYSSQSLRFRDSAHSQLKTFCPKFFVVLLPNQYPPAKHSSLPRKCPALLWRSTWPSYAHSTLGS